MSKRKKRNAVTLVSLLLVLAALIGLYAWYSTKPAKTDDDTDKTDTAQLNLVTLDTSKVTEIQYKSADANIKLNLEDGVWKSTDDPNRPISQDYVKGLLDKMSSIKANQEVVKVPEDLSEYGLDQPKNEIHLTLKDGSLVSLLIGDEVGSADGYYAMVNDDKTVYMIPISFSFDYKDMDFTAKEQAPSITAENITYLSIDKRDGDDIELTSTNTNTYDNSGSTFNGWRIRKPYEGNYAADSTKLSDVLAKYTSFDFITCVDYSGNDFDKYGLLEPADTIDIKYIEQSPSATPAASKDDSSAGKRTGTEKEYKLIVGDQNDNGDYYVRVDGSAMVYTLDKATVEGMLKVDVFGFMSPYINIPNIQNVDEIKAEIAGKEYTLGIKHSIGKDKDGKETDSAIFSYNGSVVDETSFKNMYQVMVMPRYDAVLKKDVDIKTLKPVMTLSFHIFKDQETSITSSFLPYDDSFYIVDKGTGSYFLVDKRTIDDMAKVISTFTAAK